MGSRISIAVRQNNGESVFLYSHWAGPRIAEDLQLALKRQQRWDDAPYLTRIIFCQMVKNSLMDETGFGITNEDCGDYPVMFIEPSTREIHVGEARWTFKQFIEMDWHEVADTIMGIYKKDRG